MASNINQLLDTLRGAVLGSPASTAPSLREAVFRRAGAPPEAPTPLPDTCVESLRRYLDRVAHAAYRIGDEDFAAMRGAGVDDDTIFELTICAALGASLERYERGLAALRGER